MTPATYKFSVNGTGYFADDVYLPSDQKITLGTTYLSYVYNKDGILYLANDGIVSIIQTTGSYPMIQCEAPGGLGTVKLYYGISSIPVLTTTSTGISVTGDLDVSVDVNISGVLYVDGDAKFNQSDRRLKDTLIPLNNGLDIVRQLQSYKFVWNSGYKKGRHCVGYLADEIQPILPELVWTGQDGYSGLYYELFVPVLSSAIQTVDTRLTKIESKEEILNDKIIELEEEIKQLKLKYGN
jgi:hypothetical protein